MSAGLRANRRAGLIAHREYPLEHSSPAPFDRPLGIEDSIDDAVEHEPGEFEIVDICAQHVHPGAMVIPKFPASHVEYACSKKPIVKVRRLAQASLAFFLVQVNRTESHQFL